MLLTSSISIAIVVTYLINLTVRVWYYDWRWWGRDICILNFLYLFRIRMRLLRPCLYLKQCLSSLELYRLLWLIKSQAVWVWPLLVATTFCDALWLTYDAISLPILCILSRNKLKLIVLLLNNTKSLLVQLHHLVVLSRWYYLRVFGRRGISINTSSSLLVMFWCCTRSWSTTNYSSCLLSIEAPAYHDGISCNIIDLHFLGRIEM